MNDFYRTQMGHRFFESTLPALVRELARLNGNVEKLAMVLGREPRSAEPAQQPQPEVLR